MLPWFIQALALNTIDKRDQKANIQNSNPASTFIWVRILAVDKERWKSAPFIWKKSAPRHLWGKLEDGRYRRRYNFELKELFGDSDVIAEVKTGRLRWAGHLARMNNNRAPIILFNNDPEGRRGVGRPKKRWIDVVTGDLRPLGVRNWRTVAQNRGNWNQILDQAKFKSWT